MLRVYNPMGVETDFKSKQRQHLPVYRECYEVDSCSRGREASLHRLVLACRKSQTDAWRLRKSRNRKQSRAVKVLGGRELVELKVMKCS